MPYTAQKPARPGRIVALSVTETLFALSWGALGGAVLVPFTDFWYAGILPALLVSVYFLAKMETAEETGPLQAFELRQYSLQRKRNVSPGRTFSRLVLTVLLTPLLLLSCITLLFKKRSIPELLSGIRISQMDRRLDPRPHRVIDEKRNNALSRSRILIAVPLAVSLAVFALLHSVPAVVNIQEVTSDTELPEHERQLLANYLELTTLHPEELEYHVRLASLYYRNNMDEDLSNQLSIIRSIDPEHAILLLGDTTTFSFEMLAADTTDSLSRIPLIPPPETVSEAPDSTSADSLDEATADSLAVPEDTVVTLPDTIVEFTPDTLAEAIPDTLPEYTPADTADVEISVPEELPEPVETETATDTTLTDGEDYFEPDTLIQP